MTPRLHNEPRPEPVRTPIGEAWVESGLLWHRVDAGTVITESSSIETVAALTALAGDRRIPAVVDIRDVRFADHAARNVFARGMEFELATALVVGSRLSQALGNAYLLMARPTRPTKVFDSLAEARVWAHDFVEPA